MWNLIYMQLLLEEHAYEVTNLGCCTPPSVLADAVQREESGLIVISTINGHGAAQAKSTLEQLQLRFGSQIPAIVIGGRLTTSTLRDAAAAEELEKAGYDCAFVGALALNRFSAYLSIGAQAQRTVA
jgi:methylaspartate mutase sigma subunit